MRRMAMAGLVAATLVGAPLSAQQIVSESYSFLKAVRDRDGTKVTEMLDKTGNSLASARDRDTGEGVLHIAVRRRDLTWISFLAAKGAPVNARDDRGLTPLAAAAQIGFTDGVQQLLASGASVDLPDSAGETPLILATQARSLPTVRLLLDNGADPRITDNVAGMSALDYAKRDGRSDAVLKVLQEAKPKPKRAVSGPQIG